MEDEKIVMGTSTNAILFYGYAWEDECDLFEDREKDWEEILLGKRGVINPWGAFPKELSHYSQKAKAEIWIADRKVELDVWYKRKETVRGEFSCEIGSHCSGECPIPYVYVKESQLLAYRGSVVEVGNINIRESWNSSLDRFLDALEIKKPHENPKWCLVSMWS